MVSCRSVFVAPNGQSGADTRRDETQHTLVRGSAWVQFSVPFWQGEERSDRPRLPCENNGERYHPRFSSRLCVG